MKKCLKSDLEIIFEPSYVKTYCPYCDSEIEINYEEFEQDMYSRYWGDWEGELVYCEDCGSYFKIDNVVYD